MRSCQDLQLQKKNSEFYQGRVRGCSNQGRFGWTFWDELRLLLCLEETIVGQDEEKDQLKGC